MGASPRVLDIVLPFYGDPALLFETIASVRRQSDPRWTLRVVDDNYPDPSIGARVRGLGDERIHYVKNAINLGANANYTRALSLAVGEYVVIMGADDRLLPHYVSRVHELIEADGPDIIQPGVAVIDGSGRRVRPMGDRVKALLRPPTTRHLLSGEPAVTSLMWGNWTYFPSLVWRRELVAAQGFKRFHVVQDLALLTDLLMAGATLALDDVVVFEYRRHDASDSAVKSISGERFDEERDFYEGVRSELERRGWKRASRAARLRVTSRSHALTQVPRALRGGQSPLPLVRHAFTGLLRAP
ncbi:glycosyltransferase family 2 protein [Nocardioides coralli]|uniref:glycosyltransferase family 2 protein n=1 Tax=Nocardioides coralli TaxID=2872154 RepID=UPI001CA3E653|nr:glycosyltransferase family 2 protein [Nocardioides coralli]QZY28025.1 glycosyltransferase [Nocardioides coralli]